MADLEPALTEWTRVPSRGALIVSAPDLENVLRRWLRMSEAQRWDYGIKMIYGSRNTKGCFTRTASPQDGSRTSLSRAGLTPEWSYRGYPRRPTPSFLLIARKPAAP